MVAGADIVIKCSNGDRLAPPFSCPPGSCTARLMDGAALLHGDARNESLPCSNASLFFNRFGRPRRAAVEGVGGEADRGHPEAVPRRRVQAGGQLINR